MSYLLGIPYVSQPEQLLEAIDSIKILWPHTVIIDNSPGRDLFLGKKVPANIPIYTPCVPLTFSQTMNLLQNLALDRSCDTVMFMHADAEALPGTPESLLALIESLQKSGKNWGAVFTNYDALAAYNLEAIKNAGNWDTSFPWYFADTDYYRRLVLAGYEIIYSGLAVKHLVSGTLKSNPALKVRNLVTFPLYKQYYIAKWGGEPGKESFLTPFNLSPVSAPNW